MSPRWIARVERGLGRLGLASGVLMYHRVAHESHDPWALCVTPERFAEQMAVLRDSFTCEPLAAFRDRSSARRPRVAVTFDDGYRDNVTRALPILERFEIPATIFIVSGAIGSAREFWWDALERCVLTPRTLPAELVLEIGGTTLRRTLGEAAQQDAENAHARDVDAADPAWRADEHEPRTARERLFLELWTLLVTLEPAERAAVLDALREWSQPDEPPAERLPMSLAELIDLAKHPLIAIGCHTVGHESLPDLPSSLQRREIAAARAALRDWTGQDVDTFSYPYGRHSEVTARIVEELGFAVACTSRPAPVTRLSRRTALPRLQVEDRDGDGFRRWLAGSLHQERRVLSA